MPHGDQARNEGKIKRTRPTELPVPFSGKARKSLKKRVFGCEKIIRGTMTIINSARETIASRAGLLCKTYNADPAHNAVQGEMRVNSMMGAAANDSTYTFGGGSLREFPHTIYRHSAESQPVLSSRLPMPIADCRLPIADASP